MSSLVDVTNKRSLDSIESCLFVLSLDDFIMPRVPTKSGYRNSIQIAKMDLSYMASMLLHAGGSTLHTANRWFDKFLQVIVTRECSNFVKHFEFIHLHITAIPIDYHLKRRNLRSGYRALCFRRCHNTALSRAFHAESLQSEQSTASPE